MKKLFFLFAWAGFAVVLIFWAMGLGSSDRVAEIQDSSDSGILPQGSKGAAPVASPDPASLQPGDAPAGLEDRLAGFPVIERQTRETAEDDVFVNVRILRTDMKFPLVRVEEQIRVSPTGGAPEVLSTVAMVANQILFRLDDPSVAPAFEQGVADLGYRVLQKQPLSGIYVIETPGSDIDALARALKDFGAPGLPPGEAEPNYLYHHSAQPNDPSLGVLWGLHNTGQSGGTPDADIDAPEAWEVLTSAPEALVAVIDSGIDQDHPDLLQNLWTNPEEIPGNGLDDDGNGYIDDLRGWDFVSNDNNPDDDNNHGTHCAGTIGAAANNSQGITGVCWSVPLVGLKFLDASGSGFTSDAVEAVAYATSIGARITSNSWGGGGASTLLENEIDRAGQAGSLFVAAAGNASANNDSSPSYPASYAAANIVSVASSDRNDNLSSFSNYGATSVDLAAPGSSIYSTIPGGGYGTMSGTSMATPHVAGALALLLSRFPDLEPAAYKEILIESVDLLPGLEGRTVSGGRMNLHQAIQPRDGLYLSPTGSFTSVGPVGGPFSPSSRTYTIHNRGESPAGWSASSDVNWLDVMPPGGQIPPNGSVEIFVTLNAESAALPEGNHPGELAVFDTGSGETHIRNITLQSGIPDYFTEQFSPSGNDTARTTFTFTPAESRGGYTVTANPADSFPTDPSGGIPLPLSDDSSMQVTLTGGDQVTLHGVAYSNFHVGSNGYITFIAGDWDYTESLSDHFRLPRISALFDDLFPRGSAVTWKRLPDRVAVTYQNVPEYSSSGSNSFQVEMFFNGTIRITLLDISAADGIIGLSAGEGVPSDFQESDMSAYPGGQSLTLELPESVYEAIGEMPAGGRVVISPAPDSDLDVTLTATGAPELVIPPSVTIPAGQLTASFDLEILDDDLLDGLQTATVSAQAGGIPVTTASVDVRDNDVHSFDFNGLPDVHFIGQPLAVSIRALDIEGRIIEVFFDPLTISAFQGETPVAVNFSGSFLFGVWNGTMTFDSVATGVRLNVASGTTSSQSQDLDLYHGPEIVLSEDEIVHDMPASQTGSRTLTLSNTGDYPLTWNLAVGDAAASQTATFDSESQKDLIPEDRYEVDPGSGRIFDMLAQRWAGEDQSPESPPGAFSGPLYDATWDGPPHVLGQRTAVGGPNSPSQVSFGNPLVVAAHGALQARPLNLIGTGGSFNYGQIRFALNESETVYHVEFEVTKTDADLLTVFFDLPYVHNIYFENGTVRFSFISLPTMTYDPAARNTVRITCDIARRLLTFQLNDLPAVSGSLTGTATGFQGIRFSATDAGAPGGVAIDNVKISTTPLAPPWVEATPVAGTLAPGGSLPIELAFDPRSSSGLLLETGLNFTSNDPDRPNLQVPLTLRLHGALDHFEVLPAATAKEEGVPFETNIIARDANGGIVTSHKGSALLGVVGAGNASLVDPHPITFSDGLWSGRLAIAIPVSEATITVQSVDAPATGSSLPFAVREAGESIAGYATWKAEFFPEGGRPAQLTADDDRDGNSNLVEYYSGTSPDDANNSPLVPVPPADPSEAGYLVVEYDRRIGASGITARIETSENLVDWAYEPESYELVGPPVPNTDGISERVRIRIPHPPGSTHRFVRLRLTVD